MLNYWLTLPLRTRILSIGCFAAISHVSNHIICISYHSLARMCSGSLEFLKKVFLRHCHKRIGRNLFISKGNPLCATACVKKILTAVVVSVLSSLNRASDFCFNRHRHESELYWTFYNSPIHRLMQL